MFIDINKIITEYKRDDSNRRVVNPVDQKPRAEGIKVVQETIRADEIKAARPWIKSKDQQSQVEGEMCIIYMLDNKKSSDRDRTKPAEILIAEGHKSFSKRLNSVQIG